MRIRRIYEFLNIEKHYQYHYIYKQNVKPCKKNNYWGSYTKSKYKMYKRIIQSMPQFEIIEDKTIVPNQYGNGWPTKEYYALNFIQKRYKIVKEDENAVNEGKIYNIFKKVITYPTIKYIERKIKNLSDEEKLLAIAKISNNLDKIFSPLNNLFASILMTLGLAIYKADNTGLNIYLISIILYTCLSVENRKIARDQFKKIKDYYFKKKHNIDKMDISDPYGEEEWHDQIEDDLITKKG